MGFIRLGIVLIIIGVLLSVTGFFDFGGTLQYLGWVVLAIGVILAILHYALGDRSAV